MKVWALTCTGGRPEAFNLCHKYMQRQSFQDFKWVVVDDCIPNIPEGEYPRVDTFLRRSPPWGPGQMTLPHNMLCGLSWPGREHEHDHDGIVVFIEDDDWYHEDYMEYMTEIASRLRNSVQVWGEGWTIYHNVKYRRWHQNKNHRHASLCATAIRTSYIPTVNKICNAFLQNGRYTIDIEMFREAEKYVILDTNYCIGIKGLPGRPGCVPGHRASTKKRFLPDDNLEILRLWIGDDADSYLKFFDDSEPVVEVQVPTRKKRRRVLPQRAEPLQRTRKGNAKVASGVKNSINK